MLFIGFLSGADLMTGSCSERCPEKIIPCAHQILVLASPTVVAKIFGIRMQKTLYIGFAGALGAVARYKLGQVVELNFKSAFPVGTLLVNVLGCFMMGLIGAWFYEKDIFHPDIKPTLMIGFLGAFTTFSTFTYNTWELFKDGQHMFAGLNVTLHLLACFVGLFVGVTLAKYLNV